ncbi:MULTISPECIES: phosphate/phosphite/phosphonate ABC transporter substrate-binding protein [Kamptonema]|uniref:phosphate/phosphite/phosphonate ABC transporter substrate-binding protein n=1 Tax=Kamptonema TaxID=1501433 RepID=UPI0001DAC3F9|nr:MULTISPECIES: phosphate/phosphite/phosphonate ABC transporter substrate-binding protein [Kamptonema]CBN56066.1 Phosphate-binding protein of phosphonate ABC transporter [Kamptonema sp. PCC 6506]
MKRRHFLELSLLFVASCSTTVNQANSSFSNLTINEPETLKFAVTDIQGIEDLQQNYEFFRKVLGEILEKKIEFFPVDNYIAAAVSLQSGELKLALTGPSEYTIIRARTNAVPIIAITRPDYHSIILVPTNSKIKSADQLKGKTIAMWEVGSTGGHLGPTKILLDAGLNPQSDFKISMLGKNGLQALKKDQVDALAIGLNRYNDLLKKDNLSAKDFRIIATGQPLPNDLIVASSNLPNTLVEKIRDRMVENQERLIDAILLGKANDKYQGAKLVPANDSDYNMIREVYKAIGQGNVFQ